MKTCSYCKKEVLETQEYCSKFCKIQAQKYQCTLERWKSVFTVILFAGILGVLSGVGITFFRLSFGLFVLGGALLLMGITFIGMPFAPLEFWAKHGIEQSKQIIRVLGILTAICGGIFIWTAI